MDEKEDIENSYNLLEEEAKYYSKLEEAKAKSNSEERYIRQYGFFDPSNQRFNIHVMGCGSSGSMTTLILSKLGFNQITCYDMDKIELHNLPNQFYPESSIGMYKTDALKKVIKDFSGLDINIINEKITPSNIASVTSGIDLNSIIVLCFDNMESRKLVYEQFKGMPLCLVDTRMGGLGWEVYVIKLDNPIECSKYEKGLDSPKKDLPCGRQSIIFTLSNLASEVSNIMVKINNNEPFPKILKREMSSYRFISDLK